MPRSFLPVLLPLLALAALAPATLAQDEGSTEPGREIAWGLFAGSLQGAEVTNTPLFGTRPELDDSTNFGALVRVAASGPWDLEVRLGFASTTFLDTPNNADPQAGPPDTVDASLYHLDVGLVPHWKWGSFTLGIPFGIGWAGTTGADDVISPQIPNRSMDLQLMEGNGPQYFAGVQGLFDVGESWMIGIDARLHRFHRMTNVIEQNANMEEFSISVMRRF